MLVTKTTDGEGYKIFTNKVPMTTRMWHHDGEQWLNIWPRPNVMLEHNYTKTETGQTATIPDWYIFPDWRRTAHSFNYIPIGYEQEVEGSHPRERRVTIGNWSRTLGSRSNYPGPIITSSSWIPHANYKNIGTDSQNKVHTEVEFYPMAPGFYDSNDKCSYVNGFLDSTWTAQQNTKFFNLHNDYWFKDGTYNSSTKTIGNNKIIIDPTLYKYNYREDLFSGELYWQPHMASFKMNRSAIYNSADYTQVREGSCEYFYCPWFYIVWSTDSTLNPSCFTAGIRGFRTNETWDWSIGRSSSVSKPSDYREMRLEIGWQTAECNTSGRVYFQADVQNGQHAIDTYINNDGFGSRIYNLGEFAGKHFFMAYISPIGCQGRTGTPEPHLLGGCNSLFDRKNYQHWYFSPPFVKAEFAEPGALSGLERPVICPLGTTIRIHSWGLGFWGGEHFDLDRTWGGGENHYRGWITKQFNTSTILWR